MTLRAGFIIIKARRFELIVFYYDLACDNNINIKLNRSLYFHPNYWLSILKTKGENYKSVEEKIKPQP